MKVRIARRTRIIDFFAIDFFGQGLVAPGGCFSYQY